MSTVLSAVVIGALLHTSAATPVPSEQLDDGISAWEIQEYDKAIALIKPLAEQGNPEAQYFMGTFYWYGSGVDRSTPVAQKWFAQAFAGWLAAAEAGNADAMVEIARMYTAGLGTDRDVDVALRWVHKAIDLNATAAYGVLADMYLEGDGVEKNRDQALKYYQKGAEAGDPYGSAMISQLSQKGPSAPPIPGL